jgi:hypothetical protein
MSAGGRRIFWKKTLGTHAWPADDCWLPTTGQPPANEQRLGTGWTSLSNNHFK